MKFYLALAFSILVGVVGQVCFRVAALKPGQMFLQPYTLLGYVAYFISSVFYILSLRHIPLSIAYPSIALSYVLVTLIAHYFLGEAFGSRQAVGLVFISLGVGLLYT